MVCFALSSELGLTNPADLKKEADVPENTHLNNEIRLFRVCLVFLSNIFFIEWAYDDYNSLSQRNKTLSCIEIIKKVICCQSRQSNIFNTEISQNPENSSNIFDSHNNPNGNSNILGATGE